MTINKSIGELTTLDGSLDKTLKASEQLKDLPQILQKYMLLGNYQIGNAKKFDSHSIFNDIGSIDGFIAQFVNLDEAQQKAFLSLSSFDEGLEDYIENTKNAVQIGEKFNSQLFEQIASQKDGITTGVLNEFMKAGGLKDAKGVLALPNTQDAIALMEDYANHCSDASKTQQLFNAGILEQENGVYKLSQAFLKEISVKQASTVATVALTAAQKAWNVVAQYGKQLLLSLGVAAVAFIATKIVDYLMNLKTHSEELVATMNDSHDAAEQATKDVEEIDTTNLDIFSEKIKQIKNDIDNGDSQQSDWKTFNGLDAFSGMSGEAIINIDKDSSHQTETETAALEKLHKTADENKISFESLIGVFESFGLVQISNSAAADDYADKLEKTMGVIDNIQSAYKACSSAVEEYNQYGYMSVDSLQALLQMDDQYLNTLELVNGKLQVNQSAYADLLATQYAEAQMEAISQAISELNAIAKGDAAEKAETYAGSGHGTEFFF